MDELDNDEFFAPSNINAIDLLLAEYREEREAIEAAAEYVNNPIMTKAFWYFFNGAKAKFNRYIPDVTSIFDLEYAIPAINAMYWGKALNLTDVLDFMPDKRRVEWQKSLTDMTTPDFEEGTVRDTLKSLMAQRMDFLSEMVDGIFSGLSKVHLTNQPEGFRKRMIIDHVYNTHSLDKKAGLIHDMRCIIAKFMKRDVPYHYATREALEFFRTDTGTWHPIDGGALRVRVYIKGTAHLDIHPDIAYRLNQILACLHPVAIPSEFRLPPKRKAKVDFNLIDKPIPFVVLELLGRASFFEMGTIKIRAMYEKPEVKWEAHTLKMGYAEWDKADKHLKKSTAEVLEAIGGTLSGKGEFIFDYVLKNIIRSIVVSGLIPDHKSHQYYPTPSRIAQIAIELSSIGDTDTCCEPQAGQGGLADYMPIERTTCVEISALNCDILKAKGFNIINADFLQWSISAPLFDRVICNPPFSEGRWLTHLETVAKIVKVGGIFTAILPVSAKGKNLLDGFDMEWHGPYDNEFVGTSISVVILKATRTI